MKNQKGFSLIELLIVVVIIGIIAAVAIPNLLASRRSANEASAISSVRTITQAEMTFLGTQARFANDMYELGSVNLLDSTLSTNPGDGIIKKSGYSFWNYGVAATATTPAEFELWVYPTVASGFTMTGVNTYYSNEVGVIFRLTGTSPTGTSTTVRAPTNGSPLNN